MGSRGRPPYPDILTPREQEVRELLAEGLTNPQIARRLGISLDGAKYHVSAILGKLGVTNRHEAASWQSRRVPWWKASALGLLAWPFKNIWWGSAGKAAVAAAAVATAVTLYPVPEGFDLSVGFGNSGGDVFVVTAEDMERLVASPWTDDRASWSPDCSRIAFSSNRPGDGSNYNIWAVKADGANPVKLTDSPHVDLGPRWSPDGTRIALTRTVKDSSKRLTGAPWPAPLSQEVYVINADGSGEIRLTDGPGFKEFTAWSPNGKRMLLNVRQEWTEESWEIYVMNADGTDMKNLSDRPGKDNNASWSPDGKLFVFESIREDDTEDIYEMNADGSNVRRLSDDPSADMLPRWSPDGKLISFTSHRRIGLESAMELAGAEAEQMGLNLSPEHLKVVARGWGAGVNVWMMNTDGSDVQHVTGGWGGGWSTCKAQH